MNYLEKIIGEIEEHSVEGIVECFRNGVSPNDYYRNEPLIYELTSEYIRSPWFKDCVKAFVDYGLEFDDKVLLAVLLDDASALEEHLRKDRNIIQKRYTLRCAFTPMFEVSLLHICAEYNRVSCAEVLVKHGADINARAGVDEYGFGGQTPIFHTVNQIRNNSKSMLDFLLANNADLGVTVAGLIWGKGYQWETLIPAVNPISYAMMGLLPQMHRNEATISNIVSRLLKAAYGIDYVSTNIPNQYLKR
ncbi:ankyrin repeat domain-containing protein [Terrimonas pollutisoli]|uniref:ankyrin repeat domain-containing protein n=1 Tax=Terrimonas pollutisoli TaxID=3034147 RepID=UPI0023EC7695|nr:ankyrin repeat domain-containing protein [Terrimonas sp. H1YJ31]